MGGVSIPFLRGLQHSTAHTRSIQNSAPWTVALISGQSTGSNLSRAHTAAVRES